MQLRTTKTKQVTTSTSSPYFIKKGGKANIKKEASVLLNEVVPDLLEYDLKVLFVGINPGLTSAAKGHHYANHTNHFWPCLSESGLVDRKVTFEDDIQLPSLYRLGFTNLTARTTRRASDLSRSEQEMGIPILNHKIATYRPRVACFVGKGIYEIYSGQKCKRMGLQETEVNLPWLSGQGETVMYVMPSTSGLVSAYQRPARMKFFQELAQIAEQRDQIYQ
ncbi:uracil-DNA glycosylase-like protein [Cokeromyces recurvatus]|uniref:uracil-DNA glycosylase-like protein n=1 Tax=Cokeromyces recurvatus TaxID=90255 RepID=UPI00222082FB|nr:uracil-DNA glycosylase-like protein [Cokeromyces recurvatus]KAI7898878.1 uracil-DNA glycosylase-like protein [Cokeromyces recurvatus]